MLNFPVIFQVVPPSILYSYGGVPPVDTACIVAPVPTQSAICSIVADVITGAGSDIVTFPKGRTQVVPKVVLT
ncbi:hypothetical protein [Tenacibaculum maritimum]|uniref:hypothetical protein n=1 Tax=Tenacibaculum maritimum TaxID=107401 RepID=UPI00388F4886